MKNAYKYKKQGEFCIKFEYRYIAQNNKEIQIIFRTIHKKGGKKLWNYIKTY